MTRPAFHLEHQTDPDEDRPLRRPEGTQTVGIYPDRWKADWALRDLLGGSTDPHYSVCETSRGWELVWTP